MDQSSNLCVKYSNTSVFGRMAKILEVYFKLSIV